MAEEPMDSVILDTWQTIQITDGRLSRLQLVVTHSTIGKWNSEGGTWSGVESVDQQLVAEMIIALIGQRNHYLY
jgi:hypothetical protein